MTSKADTPFDLAEFREWALVPGDAKALPRMPGRWTEPYGPQGLRKAIRRAEGRGKRGPVRGRCLARGRAGSDRIHNQEEMLIKEGLHLRRHCRRAR